MKTKLFRTTVDELDDEDFKKCFYLNFGPDGDMQYLLRHYRNYPKEAYVYMIKSLTDDKLLSWALVVQVRDNSKKFLEAQFYTRACMRRRGYGRRLIAAIKKDFAGVYTIQVLGHDRTSSAFFQATAAGIKDYYTGKLYTGQKHRD